MKLNVFVLSSVTFHNHVTFDFTNNKTSPDCTFIKGAGEKEKKGKEEKEKRGKGRGEKGGKKGGKRRKKKESWPPIAASSRVGAAMGAGGMGAAAGGREAEGRPANERAKRASEPAPQVNSLQAPPAAGRHFEIIGVIIKEAAAAPQAPSPSKSSAKAAGLRPARSEW